jgi:hypothetical protein
MLSPWIAAKHASLPSSSLPFSFAATVSDAYYYRSGFFNGALAHCSGIFTFLSSTPSGLVNEIVLDMI